MEGLLTSLSFRWEIKTICTRKCLKLTQKMSINVKVLSFWCNFFTKSEFLSLFVLTQSKLKLCSRLFEVYVAAFCFKTSRMTPNESKNRESSTSRFYATYMYFLTRFGFRMLANVLKLLNSKSSRLLRKNLQTSVRKRSKLTANFKKSLDDKTRTAASKQKEICIFNGRKFPQNDPKKCKNWEFSFLKTFMHFFVHF